ncbi:hypothetical protein LB504_010026 [Fusarium proliferatum]|nr:hypothetical protein LB504_010026 [Fusarium proliferatum]
MCQKVDKNGNIVRQESEDSVLQAPVSFARSADGSINHSQYRVKTFPIPAQEQEYDYDHRRTITILSQQHQWPQDIWVYGPHGQQLYQPVLMIERKTETTVQDGKRGPNEIVSMSDCGRSNMRN